jgi:predicted  nucleic acid-binding Zn-ribbon protein
MKINNAIEEVVKFINNCTCQYKPKELNTFKKELIELQQEMYELSDEIFELKQKIGYHKANVVTEATKCVAGCKVYTGGEIRHHKHCPYYPESLSKMYDDLKAENDELKDERLKFEHKLHFNKRTLKWE